MIVIHLIMIVIHFPFNKTSVIHSLGCDLWESITNVFHNLLYRIIRTVDQYGCLRRVGERGYIGWTVLLWEAG